jgi:hypothetical protein
MPRKMTLICSAREGRRENNNNNVEELYVPLNLLGNLQRLLDFTVMSRPLTEQRQIRS